MTYEDRKNVAGHTSDEARLWLKGFVQSVGEKETLRLLDGVGREEVRAPESSTSMVGDSHCSINFFGFVGNFYQDWPFVMCHGLEDPKTKTSTAMA